MNLGSSPEGAAGCARGTPLLAQAREAVARLGDGSALSLLEAMVEHVREGRAWYWTAIGDVRRLALAVSIFDRDEGHRPRWERVAEALRQLEEANGDEPTQLQWWGDDGAPQAVS